MIAEWKKKTYLHSLRGPQECLLVDGNEDENLSSGRQCEDPYLPPDGDGRNEGVSIGIETFVGSVVSARTSPASGKEGGTTVKFCLEKGRVER